MFIWFIEVPIVLLLIMGLLLIVGAQMLADAVLSAMLYPLAAMLVLGLLMLAIAFVLFWVTVVMQHYDERKTNICDRIMKMLGIRGALLSAVGFLAYVAINT